MPNKKAERAKIFLPFESLKGLRRCLQEKERIIVERKELSEDDCDLLNRRIHQIKVGMMIQIVYYDQGEYVALEGMVSRVQLETQRMIQIVDQKVCIDDIISIEGQAMI